MTVVRTTPILDEQPIAKPKEVMTPKLYVGTRCRRGSRKVTRVHTDRVPPCCQQIPLHNGSHGNRKGERRERCPHGFQNRPKTHWPAMGARRNTRQVDLYIGRDEPVHESEISVIRI